MSAKQKKKRKPLPPHWYMQYNGECPLCWADKSYRVRMFTPRPKKIEDRHVWLSDTETYDWCEP